MNFYGNAIRVAKIRILVLKFLTTQKLKIYFYIYSIGIAGIKLLSDIRAAIEHSEINYTSPITQAEIENESEEDVILIQDSLQSTIEQMQSLNLISGESSDNEQEVSTSTHTCSNTYVDTLRK